MIVAHIFEGLTGIPIVSTLTMLWVTLGVLVAGGILDGQLTLAAVPASVAAPVVEEAPAAQPKRQKGRGQGGRTTTRPGTVPRTTATRTSGSYSWTYALIAALVMVLVWFWNVQVSYADMWYNQASSFQPQNQNEEIYKLSRLLSAIDHAPRRGLLLSTAWQQPDSAWLFLQGAQPAIRGRCRTARSGQRHPRNSV